MKAGQNDATQVVDTKGERMKGRFLLAALVVLVSVLAAGCGGSSKSSEGDTGEGGGAKAEHDSVGSR